MYVSRVWLWLMTILLMVPGYRFYRPHFATQRLYGISRLIKPLKSLQSNDFILPPLKLHVFIDGTWLYYSVKGRDDDSNRGCSFKKRLGDDWYHKYSISWNKLIQIINNNIYKQLQQSHGSSRAIETLKTTVFTSTRPDTDKDSRREMMIEEFINSNFEVHRFVTAQLQEKCVDISLAVEMLSLATVPDAYDIAVIITGDKDFVPALQKTRSKGKRIAICSMRTGCSRDLIRPDFHIRDFDVIWIEDYIDEFVVKRQSSQDTKESLIAVIREAIVSDGKTHEGKISINSRDLGRKLQKIVLPGQPVNALAQLKSSFFSMHAFLEKNSNEFEIVYNEDKTAPEFMVALRSATTTIDEDDDVDSISMSDQKGFADAIDGNDEYFDTTDSEVDKHPAPVNTEQLGKLTVLQLKEMLKAKGLSVSGRKQELIERIASSGDVKSPQTDLDDCSAAVYKLITDFIESHPTGYTHTRTLGRYLGRISHDDGGTILSVIKQKYGGLESFVESNHKFMLNKSTNRVELRQ